MVEPVSPEPASPIAAALYAALRETLPRARAAIHGSDDRRMTHHASRPPGGGGCDCGSSDAAGNQNPRPSQEIELLCGPTPPRRSALLERRRRPGALSASQASDAPVGHRVRPSSSCDAAAIQWHSLPVTPTERRVRRRRRRRGAACRSLPRPRARDGSRGQRADMRATHSICRSGSRPSSRSAHRKRVRAQGDRRQAISTSPRRKRPTARFGRPIRPHGPPDVARRQPARGSRHRRRRADQPTRERLAARSRQFAPTTEDGSSSRRCPGRAAGFASATPARQRSAGDSSSLTFASARRARMRVSRQRRRERRSR